MSLREYRRKRDFSSTPEPTTSEKRAARRRFVIQKHAASRLHYDFRLELGGTLKSWALPKGLPFARGEKRLAVQVEDHPLSYRNFEGTIPKGEYGGGTVMVWDEGTFEVTSKRPLVDLEKGKLDVALAGRKVAGTWHLVRLRGEENQWLIIRGGDDSTPLSAEQDDTSVLTGRTMAQIAEEHASQAPDARPSKPGGAKSTGKGRTSKGGAKVPMNSTRRPDLVRLEPMKALLVDGPRTGEWTYEVKFDGYRVIAHKDGEQVRLLSRNDSSLDERFPEIVAAVQGLHVERAVLDGEVVALDGAGRSSFQLLQRSELGERPPVQYYVFDLLQEDGESLTEQPIEERRARLEQVLETAPHEVRLSKPLSGDVQMLLDKARELGLEGLIGKRAASKYEPGKRSGAWVKLKIVHEQEFVIGGFTPPSGSRSGFGALLLGVHDQVGGRKGRDLICVGKVGTGFDDATLRSLLVRLRSLEQDESPFVDLPARRAAPGAKRPAALGSTALRGVRWVRPELVCQVRFTEWTAEGRLRHPSFIGLREDKPAQSVVRERPRAPRTRKA
jgi:bifunctional non-homologous end joining protein LigD